MENPSSSGLSWETPCGRRTAVVPGSRQRQAAFPLDRGPGRGNCAAYVTSRIAADQLGHELAMRLRAAYSHLRRSSNWVLSSFGMTSDQYVLLTVLAQEGEATQQGLVRRCYSDTATVGTMVSLLEAKGLLTRTPHPRDGRARSVKLTRTGHALAEKMRRGSSDLRVNLVGLFEEQELRTLIEFLERLAGAMRPPARKTTAARSRQPPRRGKPSGKADDRTSHHL